ncbi:hypothetical protein COLO4_26624 [Corchorus olitorius]|uniref:Uncharacterized protein n=1 Tax=Corchorus olitorius TaxID=93759 RepID=A0A1R3HVQ0_9ROSI|nr:hypothetical protein COLO4_26624 [Corchorus olitorius]
MFIMKYRFHFVQSEVVIIIWTVRAEDIKMMLRILAKIMKQSSDTRKFKAQLSNIQETVPAIRKHPHRILIMMMNPDKWYPKKVIGKRKTIIPGIPPPPPVPPLSFKPSSPRRPRLAWKTQPTCLQPIPPHTWKPTYQCSRHVPMTLLLL